MQRLVDAGNVTRHSCLGYDWSVIRSGGSPKWQSFEPRQTVRCQAGSLGAGRAARDGGGQSRAPSTQSLSRWWRTRKICVMAVQNVADRLHVGRPGARESPRSSTRGNASAVVIASMRAGTGPRFMNVCAVPRGAKTVDPAGHANV